MTATKNEVSGGGINLRCQGRRLLGECFQVGGMRADVRLFWELPPSPTGFPIVGKGGGGHEGLPPPFYIFFSTPHQN